MPTRRNFPGHVQSRQETAKERQTASDARTPEQQIARLDAGGYTATKERTRLERQIRNRKQNKKNPAPEAEVSAE